MARQGRRLTDVVRELFPGADPQRMIAEGRVLVDGVPARSATARLRPGAHVTEWRSRGLRGSAKLSAALERFAVPVEGCAVLDVGAAAGGFTAVLLEAGARVVYAVDAGFGQLAGWLRQDARVVNLEAVNVGDLTTAHVPDSIDVVTVDVSYLSLSAAVAQLDRLRLGRPVHLVGLVKPMFELRTATAPTDRASLDAALAAATEGVGAAGWEVLEAMDSPITGSRGAPEMLLHARRA